LGVAVKENPWSSFTNISSKILANSLAGIMLAINILNNVNFIYIIFLKSLYMIKIIRPKEEMKREYLKDKTDELATNRTRTSETCIEE
jgi:hypothetical protein